MYDEIQTYLRLGLLDINLMVNLGLNKTRLHFGEGMEIANMGISASFIIYLHMHLGSYIIPVRCIRISTQSLNHPDYYLEIAKCGFPDRSISCRKGITTLGIRVIQCCALNQILVNRHCHIRVSDEVDGLLNRFEPSSILQLLAEVGHEPIAAVIGAMEASGELILTVWPESSNDKVGTTTNHPFYWTVMRNSTIFDCCFDLAIGLGSGPLNEIAKFAVLRDLVGWW